jgi:hypothetical protein
MTIGDAFVWMLRVCAIGIVVDAIEQLVRRDALGDDGLYAWRILRHRLDLAPRFVRRAADASCAGSRRPAAVLALRLAAVVGVVASPVDSAVFAGALTVLLATQLYHFARRGGLGIYASDQMTLIIVGAAWLGIVVDGSPLGMKLALWFVVAQSCLSYFVNGAAKLFSLTWRSGRALPAVFGTYANGSAGLHGAVASRPRLALLLCWATMLWECAFPLALVVPEPMRIAILVSGVLFHLAIATTMGIHLFVWTFPATYVGIWVAAS